jgi:hypothetical protein
MSARIRILIYPERCPTVDRPGIKKYFHREEKGIIPEKAVLR